MWGLPFDPINEEAESDIGRSIGELVEVDYKSFSSDQSRFLWIRVEVPLDKPLRRGGPVISLKWVTSRVAFWYERLVGWCFNCGRIGHDQKECSSSVNAEDGDRLYGEWLKVGIKERSMEAKGAHNHPNQSQQTPRAKTQNRETNRTWNRNAYGTRNQNFAEKQRCKCQPGFYATLIMLFTPPVMSYDLHACFHHVTTAGHK